jgi:methyl-accepting chemotaxis protein
MNIRQKLLLGAGALTLLPVTITAFFLWQNATSVSKSAVGELTQSQLTSLRDAKRAQVQDEINNRVRDLQSLASQRSTVEAMRGFKVAYSVAAKESQKFDMGASRERLSEFVKTQFAPEFAKRNSAALADPVALATLADPNGLLLQSDFILTNKKNS